MAEFLKILSIDGGGSRGIIPATILHQLYLDTGFHPLDIFDLFAGTSTGGILQTGYAFGLSTAQLQELYLRHARTIFADNLLDDIRDGFGKNTGADYSNNKFKKLLGRLFGDATLGDIHERLGPRGKSLMVCTFNLNPQKEGRPLNYRPSVYHSNFIRDKDLSLVDLTLRTSAGPTYFPIYQNHVDGGVSLNNPGMAAIAFAINRHLNGQGQYRYPDGKRKGLGKALADLQLFSMGCGTSNQNYISATLIQARDKGDWGNLQWVRYLPDMLTESNMQASDYYVNQLLAPGQYLRLQPAFDHPQTPPLIRGKRIGMDVKQVRILKAMKEYAEQIYAHEREAILRFLKKDRPVL